jgi:hypothetical protein
MNLTELQTACHSASHAAGWWHHPITGLPYIPGDNLASGALWECLTITERDLIIHYWPFVLATKIALIHSEVSEGLEGLRKNLMDDKLIHRSALETEMADNLIRTFDIGGAVERARTLGVVAIKAPFDLQAAVGEKMSFNAVRPDHKVAARRAVGGKAF